MQHSQWQTGVPFVEKSKWYHATKPLHFIGILGGLVALLGGFWYFWSSPTQNQEDIPVVRVQPGPIRIRPESTEVTDIPHQDKLIYDELTGASGGLEETSSREPSEDPLDLPPMEPDISARDDFPIASGKALGAQDVPEPPEPLQEGSQGVYVRIPQSHPPLSSKDKKQEILVPTPSEKIMNLSPRPLVPGPQENPQGDFEKLDLNHKDFQENQSVFLEEQGKNALRSLPLSKLFSLEPPKPKGGFPSAEIKNSRKTPFKAPSYASAKLSKPFSKQNGKPSTVKEKPWTSLPIPLSQRKHPAQAPVALGKGLGKGKKKA